MERVYLEDILTAKKKRLEKRKLLFPEMINQISEVGEQPSFYEAMSKKHLSIIGEIKKASPSRGIIRKKFNPVEIGNVYKDSVDAISVLTEEDYFLGCDDYLKQISRMVDIPVLCKDFIIDSYQIYNAKALGASCVLLIVNILTDHQLNEFLFMTKILKMDALVEVHTKDEIKRAINAGAKIIGINNRDLTTFKTDIQTTLELRPCIPDSILVISESGIHTAADIKKINKAGVNGILVGESFMRSDNIKERVEAFRHGC